MRFSTVNSIVLISALLGTFSRVNAHGKMTVPVSRTDAFDNSDALSHQEGFGPCGQSTAGVESVPGSPTVAWAPGSTQTVSWTITIAHPGVGSFCSFMFATSQSQLKADGSGGTAFGPQSPTCGDAVVTSLSETITVPSTIAAGTTGVFQWFWNGNGQLYYDCADVCIGSSLAACQPGAAATSAAPTVPSTAAPTVPSTAALPTTPYVLPSQTLAPTLSPVITVSPSATLVCQAACAYTYPAGSFAALNSACNFGCSNIPRFNTAACGNCMSIANSVAIVKGVNVSSIVACASGCTYAIHGTTVANLMNSTVVTLAPFTFPPPPPTSPQPTTPSTAPTTAAPSTHFSNAHSTQTPSTFNIIIVAALAAMFVNRRA